MKERRREWRCDFHCLSSVKYKFIGKSLTAPPQKTTTHTHKKTQQNKPDKLMILTVLDTCNVFILR